MAHFKEIVSLAVCSPSSYPIPFRSNPPFYVMTSMPEEDEYSDDTDFLGEELIQLEFILPVAAKVFRDWSLNINKAKTEFIDFYYT